MKIRPRDEESPAPYLPARVGEEATGLEFRPDPAAREDIQPGRTIGVHNLVDPFRLARFSESGLPASAIGGRPMSYAGRIHDSIWESLEHSCSEIDWQTRSLICDVLITNVLPV